MTYKQILFIHREFSPFSNIDSTDYTITNPEIAKNTIFEGLMKDWLSNKLPR